MRSATAFNNTTSAFRPFDTTSVLRPAQMNCPGCARARRVSVLNNKTMGKVDFKHCGACGGVWFQQRESDLALRMAADCDWPAPQGFPDADKKEGELLEWSCPCCQGNLVNIHDRRGSGASVRRCLVCYGGWIEYADLQAAASRDLLALLGRSVRGILGKS